MMITVPDDIVAVRLDQFLVAELPGMTRAAIQRLIETDHIQVNNKPVRPSLKLKGGESVHVELPEPVAAEPQAEQIELDILYEDADLIVVNKPAGMVVHPGAGNNSGTLVNALLGHCKDLSGIGGELRPGIVHRLDKGTSGVMVAAKNDRAHQSLSVQFSEHTIKRIYTALIYGNPKTDTGRIEGIIGRHPTDRLRLTGRVKHGKHAVTRWRVKRRYGRVSLVELRLETGRTHQIRVHMSEAGFPLLGDQLYLDGGRFAGLTDPQLRKMVSSIGRQTLHAGVLGFVHPSSGEYMEFTAAVADDMATLIDYLECKYGHTEQG